MRILFDSKLSQFKTPFGTLQENETCTFHILIPCSCRTTAAALVLQAENGQELRRVPLTKQSDDTLYDTWGGEMAVCEAGLYFYYFHITTQDGAFRLFKQGQSDTNMEAGGLWQLSVLADKYPVPAGCAGAVMYQIFPDRFCQSGSCDLTGKITPYWVHENKDDVPVYLPDANGEVLNNDFYGGNLNGIREKLPYLQELGVEILYLNPIFYAWSTHRYDTCDYKRIDPMLGTEEDFRALCAEAHAHGMKVILDGVFSHVGSRSAYFQQAIHDPSSPYRGWFRFQHYPDVYDSWWGITTLPCVDKMNPDFIRYMIDDEDSVAVHWLKLGADGWRLDVVDELPDAFLARLRARIRAYKPDALLIGEVWEDASHKVAYGQMRSYVLGDTLDSVMNYPLRDALIAFLMAQKDAAAVAKELSSLAQNYPKPFLYALMNLMGSHDRPRILNVLAGNDGSDIPRSQRADHRLSQEERMIGALREQLMLRFVFSVPGMPCIYYGDEAGVEGCADPFCRRTYPWGREDQDMLARYKAMAAMRNGHPVLKTGECAYIAPCSAVLGVIRKNENGKDAFGKKAENACAVTLINRSAREVVVYLTSADVSARPEARCVYVRETCMSTSE